MVNPRLDDGSADRMGDDNGVFVAVGDSSDQVFTILPQCEILAVALIAIDCDVAFAGISIDKHKLEYVNERHWHEMAEGGNKHTATSWPIAALAAPAVLKLSNHHETIDLSCLARDWIASNGEIK